jgi:hypothetical protein
MKTGNNGVKGSVRTRVGLVALCVVALATACTTTQQVAVKEGDLKCGFLGSDCDRLTPGAKGQFDLRYVNSNANWR